MLIHSPRHRPGDLDAWTQLERYDAALADTPHIANLEKRAHQTIRTFADNGDCYASTSWGKDSTVVAHLVATSGLKLPLIYVRQRKYENPDCLLVRDQFLDRYGDYVDYHEYFVDPSTRWWHDTPLPQRKGGHAIHYFREAEKRFGGRHISGVRGEESSLRDMVQRIWGDAGPNAARPIGRWTAVDVFAYLYRHDLPVHPAYAMNMGGHYDRRWLRVSPIGGLPQAHKKRADWEATYYPDIVGT